MFSYLPACSSRPSATICSSSSRIFQCRAKRPFGTRQIVPRATMLHRRLFRYVRCGSPSLWRSVSPKPNVGDVDYFIVLHHHSGCRNQRRSRADDGKSPPRGKQNGPRSSTEPRIPHFRVRFPPPTTAAATAGADNKTAGASPRVRVAWLV